MRKVCDKAVCKRLYGERWFVTKLCVCVKDGVVKDGVRQSCVCERGCGERWCVCARWCAKDGGKDGV